MVLARWGKWVGAKVGGLREKGLGGMIMRIYRGDHEW